MNIAVNTRFLFPDYREGYGSFIYEIFKRITQEHPDHNFIFIFDRPFDEQFIFSKNILPLVVGPAARHPLLWKYWYDVKIPAALKKYKADIFISPDGFCSLRTKVPQCLVVHDLAFLHYPSYIRKSHLFFYKKFTPKFLNKAKTIATVSEFTKQDIAAHYKITSEKIDVVYNAAKEIFKPLPGDEKEKIKIKYAEGHEYFLYTGAIHPRKNLITLLKAFSIFKKRLKSNFKLVLAGRLAWKNDAFLHNLKTYKYRHDVIMTGYVPEKELVKIMGAAYALVYPSLWEGFGVPVAEALRCEVPVITSANSSMQEIAEEAALYSDPKNFEELAEKMMTIYKDETLRKELIQKGKIISEKYSLQKTAELLWQTILKTAPEFN